MSQKPSLKVKNNRSTSSKKSQTTRRKKTGVNKDDSAIVFLNMEFTAKEVQAILRAIVGDEEKIGLALLNYYARTDLVPCSGNQVSRGRKKYSYSDLVLLGWLFRMKSEGLPVNRFRTGIDYLRKKMPKLMANPMDIILLTDGKNLFLKNKIEDKESIAEIIAGNRSGQYVWAYAIGNLIEEIEKVISDQFKISA